MKLKSRVNIKATKLNSYAMCKFPSLLVLHMNLIIASQILIV
jgi:hypothetical protein